jgi:ribonucleoside-diphosphate reductase subunit M2
METTGKNSAPSTRKAEKTSDLSEKPSKHKIAENKGFAPEPLLQENPHRFVLFPIHYNDI